jgi:hypothetical protein
MRGCDERVLTIEVSWRKLVCQSRFPSRTVSGMEFRFGFAPTVTSSSPCKTMAGKSERTFARASKSGSNKAGAIAASKRSLKRAKQVEQERTRAVPG